MWLFAGAIAFLVAIVNLVRVANGKDTYCSVLVFISMASGLLAMLSQYGMIKKWVQAGDMSALMDVVPSMSTVLILAVCVGILLNAAAVFVSRQKEK